MKKIMHSRRIKLRDWWVGERGILNKNDRKGYSGDIHWDLNDMKSELEGGKEEEKGGKKLQLQLLILV